MGDLTLRILEVVARLSGREADTAVGPHALPAGTPDPSRPGATASLVTNPVGDAMAPAPRRSLTLAEAEDFARQGIIVELFSRTLNGPVYVVPDAAAGAALLEEGVPRHRLYLPAEIVALASLLDLDSERRAQEVRTLNAARETFGPDTEVVSPALPEPGEARCPSCHGPRFWRSVAGRRVCGRCYSPADPSLVVGWEGEA